MEYKPKLDKSHRKSMKYRGTKCLNCAHPLDKSDIYCPHCSQLNSKKQLSVKDFLAEFVGSILVYDSRLRHTLRDLLFRPGRITLNYVQGQRLKYANPFRFFLSVSIIYFLLQGIVALISPQEEAKSITYNTKITSGTIDSTGIHRPPITFKSAIKGDTITAKKLEISRYLSEKVLDTLSFMDDKLERSAIYLDYHYQHPEVAPSAALDSLHHINSFKSRWIYSRMIALKKIIENPTEFTEYITAKIPFFLFFFTPFFAVFFWMLYSRKKYTYMEHMIFIFHIFSFLFLTKLFFTFLVFIIDETYLDGLLILLLGPLYFYFALRNFYQESHLSTLLKFGLLSLIFNIGFFIAISLFVAGSAAIY